MKISTLWESGPKKDITKGMTVRLEQETPATLTEQARDEGDGASTLVWVRILEHPRAGETRPDKGERLSG